MKFKKLSITCLSMLFSIVPIYSSAMKENLDENSNINSSKELNKECAICQIKFESEIQEGTTIIMPCGHRYHIRCLYKSVWLSKDYESEKFIIKSYCPFCRDKVNAKFRYDLKKAVENFNKIAKDNEKIDIVDKTIDVHNLPEMQGKTDEEIVNLLVDKYLGKSVFVHYDNDQDETILNILLNEHLDLFTNTYENYKIPYGAICACKTNFDNPDPSKWFDFYLSEMLVDTENGKKLLVIENRDLGEKFEKALKGI